MTLKRRNWLLTACAATAAVAGVMTFKRYFWNDRERYEPIVAHLRALGMKPGETREFWWEPGADPASIRPYASADRPARGKGAGHIWARVRESGGLQVVIETRDLGHAGEYGVAYSDDALTPAPFGDGWYTIDVPGHLTLVQPQMQIDAHWWKVVHNLD